MPKININGTKVEFEQGMTVLQACELAGVEVPRFCYHERLEIAGNCRMCLVQIEGGPPKPAASCAMPAGDGMVVHTNTPMVKKAREGVMEFQLINHPLDCPTCDQGGECDLQDQAMIYGKGKSRFKEKKHAVKEKNYGPLISTYMTRCIHCTRCVRFMEDIAGTSEIGATGRGEDMSIGTFIQKNVTSELSGNIIDLCPVGALTSKPYSFTARSWELRKTQSIDVMDAVGCNIRVDARGNEVMRILPRLNEDINEEWISDKARFSYDGLKLQRLDKPYLRNKGKLRAASFDDVYEAIAKKIKKADNKKIAAIAGDLADCESMFALKKLMESLKAPNLDCRVNGAALDAENRGSYLFNSTIAGVEQADAILFIGTNPRLEAPIINARIRKRATSSKPFYAASIGKELDLTYDVNNLGDSLDILEEIAAGNGEVASRFKDCGNPMIIVGADVFARKDAEAIKDLLGKIVKKYAIVTKGWNGFNVLHKTAAIVGGLELGFVPKKSGKGVEAILNAAEKGNMDVVFLLGADEIDVDKLKNSFVIYIGHHGDKGAQAADVILPASAYTEKNATYVNMEGRAQRTRLAIFPPAQAKEDWLIVSEIANNLGFDSYDSLVQLRAEMKKSSPVFENLGEVTPAKWLKFGEKGKLLKAPIDYEIENFYMTDVISRASKIMAKCVKEFTIDEAAEKEKIA